MANSSDSELPVVPKLGNLDSSLSQKSAKNVKFKTNLDCLDPSDLLSTLTAPEYDGSQDHLVFISLIVLEGIAELLTILTLIWLILKF